MTVVADISTPANRGRNMSFYQGSILIGTGLGPTLGGALAGQTGSYRLPFFVFALLTLLAAIWVWLMLPETQDYGRTDLNSGHVGHLSSMSPRFLLTDLNFLLVGVINFGIFFSRAGTQMELLPLIGAEEVGLNPEQIGVALTFAAVANFFVLSPAGWIADRFSRKIAIVPANLVMGLSLVVFIYTDNYLMFLLAVILYGIASGFGGPAPAAYVADIVPRHAYGLAMGTVRTFGDLGFVVAPMVLGWLSDLHSYDLALWFNALLMSGSALAFGLWAREKRAKTE